MQTNSGTSIEPKITAEEAGKKAQALYNGGIKNAVETPETIGQFVAIDTLSGDYEVGPDYMATVAALRARHETVHPFTLRIGYTSTFTRGGGMVRTA